MYSTLQGFRIVAASALASCGALLAVGWPTVGQAEGPGPALAAQGAIGQGTSQVGHLLVSARLVAGGAGRCFVDAVARNPSDQDVAASRIELSVTRTESMPMARVMPMPEVVWHGSDVLSVAAGEQASLRRQLPAELCAAMAQRPTREPGDANVAAMHASVSFRAAASAAAEPSAAPSVPRTLPLVRAAVGGERRAQPQVRTPAPRRAQSAPAGRLRANAEPASRFAAPPPQQVSNVAVPQANGWLDG